MKKSTKMVVRLKIDVEPNLFEIMPCASIYSVVKSSLEVSNIET